MPDPGADTVPPVTDGRPPLDRDALWARLSGGFVTSLDVVPQISSTNAELMRAVTAGAGPSGAEGRVLVAEWQQSGRGRFDRVWTSPPRAGLTFSTILRPAAVPVARWPWLPLLAGVALRSAVQSFSPGGGADVWLKWPNDLMLGPTRAKAAGILAEVTGDAVILGMGVNVHNTVTELPGPQTTSLDLAFPELGVDRGDLLVAVLGALAERYGRWTACAGDAAASGLRAEYEGACDTIGRVIQVDGGRGVGASVAAGGAAGGGSGAVTGTATGVSGSGALMIDTDDGPRAVSAGHVAQVRPGPR